MKLCYRHHCLMKTDQRCFEEYVLSLPSGLGTCTASEIVYTVIPGKVMVTSLRNLLEMQICLGHIRNSRAWVQQSVSLNWCYHVSQCKNCYQHPGRSVETQRSTWEECVSAWYSKTKREELQSSCSHSACGLLRKQVIPSKNTIRSRVCCRGQVQGPGLAFTRKNWGSLGCSLDSLKRSLIEFLLCCCEC